VDEAALSPEEFRKKHQIHIDNHDITDPTIDPFASFDLTPFDDRILRVFEREGYTAPTVTQSQSWPIALQGRDMISVAKTGSGKTFAFLVPAISKLLESKVISRRHRRGSLPKVLVLAPTRELCVQISEEAEKFASIGLRTVAVYGGASRGVQIRALRDGADLVVATPGRCNDLLECGALSLRDAHYGVLDEADRMLDM
jgi:ATP-dependent RNA helicase DDX5/DBP2